ncbi:uncharacterized protein B0H18DRAFT_1126447 [Fomitopsis serialis]|uniref:uncharacterized protein n=1 Tax=Fomitopsis serialis TaxID=139415 RepID=UPI002008B531|nr:uncharacterized protein B0H18DRAFT_1126447 [Neoantrodia serialis]KAH9913242.1 hypothetical protein B0H18DRAFT_1126447 [Neoantrodia serialis]
MYKYLVDGFEVLCNDMDIDKRPSFYQGASKQWLSPYRSWRRHQQFMSPDIVALPPGTTLGPNEQPHEWKQVCFVVEVKGSNHPDPITSQSEKAIEHRVQIMRDAGNVMLATGSLCVFVIGIYGQEARIFRVDHAGAVGSCRFNYTAQPEVLWQFIWCFFHPNTRAQFIGADDTCWLASAEDVAWANLKEVCTTADGRWDANAEEESNRWVKIPSNEGEHSIYQEYLLLRPIYVDPNTFCPATCVRQAVLKGDQSGKRYIVKDAWRQRARKHPEMAFYERIEQYCREKGVPYTGIARLANGVDFGCEHPKSLHEAQSMSANAPSDSPTLHPRDRHHMPIVLDTVGIPLDQFPSTRVLIEALRDAVKGHQLAFLAGVMHRDISKGNILILLGNALFKGFICDLDCSSFIDSTAFGGSRLQDYNDEDTLEHDLKERTGTFRYFAIELLHKTADVLHRVHHDLESFYWVILWIVVRHTDHEHPEGAALCSTIFPTENEIIAKSAKIAWLSDGEITIRGNKPLTDLMTNLSALAENSRKRKNRPVDPLTHEAFILVLDEALKAEGWPENDKARPFVPPHVDADGKVVKTGTKRTRGADDESNRSTKRKKPSAEEVPLPQSEEADNVAIEEGVNPEKSIDGTA